MGAEKPVEEAGCARAPATRRELRDRELAALTGCARVCKLRGVGQAGGAGRSWRSCSEARAGSSERVRVRGDHGGEVWNGGRHAGRRAVGRDGVHEGGRGQGGGNRSFPGHSVGRGEWQLRRFVQDSLHAARARVSSHLQLLGLVCVLLFFSPFLC